MRDILNTEEGYKEIICKNNEYIKLEFEDLNSYVVSDDNDKIKETYWNLLNYTLDVLKAEYSLGSDVGNLLDFYKKTSQYILKSWIPESGYVQMIDMLSLGIILDIEDEEFNKLVALVEKENVKDYLIDFLIRSRNSSWPQTEGFIWKKPYKGISEIVSCAAEDKEKAMAHLKKYLNEWYRSIEIKTHNSKWNIHTGYWCWEAGALAKILKLEDAALKNQQYYPYDLVHWK
ncbi:PoNe immunity protein domain-containing protein [Pedobacter petrophilus]|nr:PoNe immunity protein domain-containing protein [Pedobacter petrophilus]